MSFQPQDTDERCGISSLEEKLSRCPVAAVPIRLLLSPDSPRLDGESEAHVHVLAESEVQLPPIIIHRATMRVIDGAHRLRAAVLRGESEIEARFFDGSEADAFVLAVEANNAHGLPLSRADRKAAAERIMASHPQWSDRAIALVTGLAAKTVGAIRRRTAGDAAQSRARVGRDGRTRPLDAADGRRRAGILIRNEPTASLRQIAVKAGISQGTARDVRDRLARGENPVTPRQHRLPKTKGPVEHRSVPDDDRLAGIGASALDRSMLLKRLKQDPSLRFTETGRSLIRLLDIHSLAEDEWNRLLDAVPAHCRETIAELVRACADMWQEHALRFDRATRA